MPFRLTNLPLRGLTSVVPVLFSDKRGFLLEVFNRTAFATNGISPRLTQLKYSFSKRGVLRGFHFQLNPKAQDKLIHVPLGRMYCVAVDIRKGSPTYARWIGMVLSQQNKCALWVPRGFALGSLAIHDSYMFYLMSGEYSKSCESGFAWDDPELEVKWPLSGPPIVSERDSRLPNLSQARNNFVYARRLTVSSARTRGA